jgi:RimJ/RimL family protein N-acetyltransferase
MRIANGPFAFELVTEANLETLRQMRNSRELAEFMHQRQEISEQQQQQWFAQQDRGTDLYFLAYRDGQLIGYCLLRHIDRQQRLGEPGTFLMHEQHRNGSEAALFMVTFLDLCYYVLDIRQFFGNVLHSNQRAMGNYAHFSKQVVEQNAQGTVFRSAGEDAYLEDTARIRKALQTTFGYRPLFQVSDAPDWIRPMIKVSEHCEMV